MVQDEEARLRLLIARNIELRSRTWPLTPSLR